MILVVEMMRYALFLLILANCTNNSENRANERHQCYVAYIKYNVNSIVCWTLWNCHSICQVDQCGGRCQMSLLENGGRNLSVAYSAMDNIRKAWLDRWRFRKKIIKKWSIVIKAETNIFDHSYRNARFKLYQNSCYLHFIPF